MSHENPTWRPEGEEREESERARPVKDQTQQLALIRKIRADQRRKVRARRDKGQSILFGMGMFGLVGWSVAIPTLVCLALGIWIDGTYETRFSWTLMLLSIGIVLGCLNAWYWVSKESRGG